MENQKYIWDLTKFCKDEADCENILQEVEKEAVYLAKFKGELGTPDKLLEFWEKYYLTYDKFCTCLIYVNAGLDTNMDNESLRLLQGKLENTRNIFESNSAFVGPELKSLGNDYLRSLKSDERFKEWELYIDNIIFTNEHTLSEAEEKMLAEVSNFTYGYNEINKNCYGADIKYNDAVDSKGNVYHLNSGNVSGFLSSPDRALRKSVAENVREAYSHYTNLMTQNFIYYIKTVVTLSKIRNYKSVLSRNLSAFRVDEKVYDNVIKCARENIDLQAMYYKVKKDVLGFDEMYNYDIPAHFEKNTHNYTFEEGVDIVKKALSVLGQEYVDLIDRAVKERWIDVYPRDKKRSFGYTWGTYSRTYIILLNWTGDINDVFTLAHELGHAIQHYFTNTTQKIQNTDQPIFLAETASTFNEIILGNYLLKNTKDTDERFVVLGHLINEIVGTVFSQANLSMFEDFCYKTIENGGNLSTEVLKQKWLECMQKPFEDIINLSQCNLLGWQNVFHFYNHSYYVWQYALAYMISGYFVENLNNDKQNALELYYKFLKGTNEYYPTEFLKKLGVDINSEEFYKQSFKGFRALFEQFKELAKDYKY